MVTVQRALISVSDKSGIVEFCRGLDQLGVAMLSTGGTFRLLRRHNVRVTDLSGYTGFPEIMDGRVKTLHPKIHGGLLGRPGRDDGIMEELDIPPIDLVVVNLYPFEATVKRAECTLAEAVEKHRYRRADDAQGPRPRIMHAPVQSLTPQTIPRSWRNYGNTATAWAWRPVSAWHRRPFHTRPTTTPA